MIQPNIEIPGLVFAKFIKYSSFYVPWEMTVVTYRLLSKLVYHLIAAAGVVVRVVYGGGEEEFFCLLFSLSTYYDIIFPLSLFPKVVEIFLKSRLLFMFSSLWLPASQRRVC